MNKLCVYGICTLFASIMIFGTLVAEGSSPRGLPPGFPIWDKLSYKIGEWGTITVDIPEKNIDSMQIDIFYLSVDSDSASSRVLIEMIETGSDTGSFSGSVLFTSNENSTEALYVEKDDTAYAYYDKFSNGVLIKGPIKSTVPLPIPKSPGLTPSPTETPEPSEQIIIPSWIRDNARWWAEGSIEDQDFVSGIQYLIEQKIMIVPSTEVSNEPALPFLPNWIKDSALWWAEGKVSDNDFVNGIQYLISHGIIVV